MFIKKIKRKVNQVTSGLQKTRGRKDAHDVGRVRPHSHNPGAKVRVPVAENRNPDDELRFWRDTRSEQNDYEMILATADAPLANRRHSKPYPPRAVSYPYASTQHAYQSPDIPVLADQSQLPPIWPDSYAPRTSSCPRAVRYSDNDIAESSSGPHAQSYSSSRALEISPKAVAANDEGSQPPNDWLVPGGLHSPSPVRVFPLAGGVSYVTPGNRRSIYVDTEVSPRPRVSIHHDGLESINSPSNAIGKKPQVMEVPTPRSPTIEFKDFDSHAHQDSPCPSMSSMIKGYHECAEMEFGLEHKGILDPHGPVKLVTITREDKSDRGLLLPKATFLRLQLLARMRQGLPELEAQQSAAMATFRELGAERDTLVEGREEIVVPGAFPDEGRDLLVSTIERRISVHRRILGNVEQQRAELWNELHVLRDQFLQCLESSLPDEGSIAREHDGSDEVLKAVVWWND